MHYRYKKPKEKASEKSKNKIRVIVEKTGENQDNPDEVKIVADGQTDEEKSGAAKKSAVFSVIVFAVTALICGFILYTNNYYHTAEYPGRIPGNVDIQTLDDGSIAAVPANPIAGFILYPDNKVEFSAYEELMLDCADSGILCIIVKMPLNLTFLNSDAADSCMEQYPDIINWYVGGHAGGGKTASEYAAKNADKLKGLILLASYPKNNISGSGLSVLSVYGSEDGILNMKKYEKRLSYLPSDASEVIIQGGCHSYFGNYGMQDGDGTPTIERYEQIDETVSAIKSLVMSDIG